MQPIANLRVLDLTQPAVDMEHELVEDLVIRGPLQAKIMVQFRRLDECPDLTAQCGCFGRIHRIGLCVLIEQLLEPRDVAICLRPRHRRHKMINDRGMRAALGLGSLAWIVDQERIDQRQ